jgi:hypothetical protein
VLNLYKEYVARIAMVLQKTLSLEVAGDTTPRALQPPPLSLSSAAVPLRLAQGQLLLQGNAEGGLQLGEVAEDGQHVALVLVGGDVELTFDSCSQVVLPWRPKARGWESAFLAVVDQLKKLPMVTNQVARLKVETATVEDVRALLVAAAPIFTAVEEHEDFRAMVIGKRSAIDSTAGELITAIQKRVARAEVVSRLEAFKAATVTDIETVATRSLRASGTLGARRYAAGQWLTVRRATQWVDVKVDAAGAVRFDDGEEPILHPWNHAPREIEAAEFAAMLEWHMSTQRTQHAWIADALSGRKLETLTQCVAINVVDGANIASIADAHGLSTWLHAQYKKRLSGGECEAPCAALLTGPPAAGKTTLLSQVVMLSLDGELVPILVKVQRLQQRLIDSPDAFASAWNFVDAFLRLEHSENIEYYRMLRQAMMARRALVLLDGLDEGGQKRTEIERHVTEVLAPQGHVMLCTSRPQGDDAAARFAAFRRLELLPLSDEQQEEALKQRLGVEAIKVLRPYIHDKVPRDENGNRVTANPLMCAIASRVHTPLTSSLPYPYQPYRCVVSSLVLDCWRRLSMVASVYTLFKGRVDENRVRIPMPKTIVDLYANASDAMLARGGVTSPALRELLQAVLLLAHMMKRREFGVEHIDMAATIVGSSRETLDEMHTRVALDQLPLLTVLQADPLLLQSSHLSFQEFFAAKGLCAQGTVLRGEPPWQWPVWWWNALRFGTEMDGFRRGLLSAAGVTSGNLNLCGQLGGHRPTVLKVVAEFVAVLTSLDLSHNDLDENAGKVLASALRSTGVLTSLNLSANRLCGVYHERGERCGSYTATGISEICLALKNNACLTSLNLSWNMLSGFRDNLQDSAVKAICELLTFNAALSWLDLSHNTLGAEGAEAIAAVLSSNTGVHMINLDGFALPVKQPHLVRTLALSNKRSRGLLSRIVITRLMESRQSHNSGEHKPPASLATAKLLAPTIAHGHASASAATCELDKEVKARLLELDDSLHLALKQGDIRLVRVAWLQQRPDTYRIQCRQELEALDNVSPSPLMTSQEAVDLICSGGRAVGALTYGWCSPGRPDPTGVRVQILRSALARFPHIKAIFWECATARSRTALSRTIVSLCSHTKHPFWQFPLALSEPGRRPAQR